MKEKIKSNNAITLVALVITIIVLLILAGVSISLVVGDNGVLTQAGNAKDSTEKADCLEALQRAIVSAQGDYTPYSGSCTFGKYLSGKVDGNKAPLKEGDDGYDTAKFYKLTENGYTIKNSAGAATDAAAFTTGTIQKDGGKTVYGFELAENGTWGITIYGKADSAKNVVALTTTKE